jgi:DNA-binding MarR family transcriptional regulator
MESSSFQLTQDEFHALHEKFREVKHSINNTLAVIMALSELAQRNPAHFEKLAKTILSRGPDIVNQLQSFSKEMTDRMKPEPAPSQPAA